MARQRNGGAPVAEAPTPAPDVTEVSEAPKADKVARHCNSGACVFCGGGTHTHFEEGAVVVACSGCRGVIRYAANVISKPIVDKVRDKIGSRYELGLVGKANYARMTGTNIIPGRKKPEKDPTDPESDDEIKAAVAPNAKAKAGAPKPE
jgi:hypothetical protein